MRLKNTKDFLSQRFGEVEDSVKLRRLDSIRIYDSDRISGATNKDMIIEAHGDGTLGEYSSLGPCRL
jgi:hypothetical protein